MKGISLLEFYAGEGFRMHGKTLPSEARDTFTYTVRRPLGVVGLIAPWNFPWAIPVWKMRPGPGRRQHRHLQTRRADSGDGGAADGNLRTRRDSLPAFSTCSSAPARSSARRWSHSPVLRAISFTGSNEIGGALYIESGPARRQSHLRDGRQKRRHRHGRCRPRQSRAGDPWRRLRLHRPALHCDLARHRVSLRSRMRSSSASSQAAKKIKLGPGLDETVDMGPAVDEKQWKTDLDYIAIGRQRRRAAGARRRAPRRAWKRLLCRADNLRRRWRRRCGFSKKKFSVPCSRSAPARRSERSAPVRQ